MRNSGEWRVCRLPADAGIDDLVVFMGKADAAIQRASDGTSTATETGTIQCPRCGASLHYRVSRRSNGYAGRCTTVGCLQWSD